MPSTTYYPGGLSVSTRTFTPTSQLNPSVYMRNRAPGSKTPGQLAMERERAYGVREFSAATKALLASERAALQPVIRAQEEKKGRDVQAKFLETLPAYAREYLISKENPQGWITVNPREPNIVDKVKDRATQSLVERALKSEGWVKTFDSPSAIEGKFPDIWENKITGDWTEGRPDLVQAGGGAWRSKIRAEANAAAVLAERGRAGVAARAALPVMYVGMDAQQGQFVPSDKGMQWVGMTSSAIPSSVEVGMSRYETLGHLGDNPPVQDVAVKALDKTIPAPVAAKSLLGAILPLVGVGLVAWLVLRRKRRGKR